MTNRRIAIVLVFASTLSGDALMKIPALLPSGLVVASLLLSAPPLRAQADACGMLKPAVLTALLGGTPAPTPHPNACIWKVERARRS